MAQGKVIAVMIDDRCRWGEQKSVSLQHFDTTDF